MVRFFFETMTWIMNGASQNLQKLR